MWCGDQLYCGILVPGYGGKYIQRDVCIKLKKVKGVVYTTRAL
jgi:hypothetical protein